jgi:PhnB protein
LPDTSNPIEAGAGSLPVPEGYHTVTPWIISRDTAGLIEFVVRAFGAEEIARIQDERGVIGHAEFRIGDSVIMGFDAKPEWPDTPAFLRLYVEDADAAHRRAIEAGATSVTEVTHLYWGDRVGRVRDPFGNVWWLQTKSYRTGLFRTANSTTITCSNALGQRERRSCKRIATVRQAAVDEPAVAEVAK